MFGPARVEGSGTMQDLFSIDNRVDAAPQFHLYCIDHVYLFRNLGGISSGAIVGIVTGGLVALLCLPIVLRCLIYVCIRVFRGPPARQTHLRNAAYVKGGSPVRYRKAGDVFKSGAFKSYSSQNGALNGSGDMKLVFSAEGGHIVSGEGTDSVGDYTVKGHYSPSALRMQLEKQYRTEAGDASKSSSPTVSMHLQWNPTSQQFEEKKNAWARLRKGHDQLIIVPKSGQHRQPFYISSNV